MIKGTVKFFNGTKGFGFITPDDGSKEVFVPSAAVTASGTGLLKAGQRVSFEAEQEAKGPKAVKLTLLDEPLKEQLKEQPREAPPPGITVYHEADTDESADVMAALEAAGCAPRQVDYMTAPPTRDELKRLSVMLRSANQSLARRYEPLYMELQLDDRFISENEFWTAIAEHPALINGPILVSSSKALICKSAADVQAFLGNAVVEEKQPKGISPRMAAMMLGGAETAPPEKETKKAEAPPKSLSHETPEAEPAPKVKLPTLKPRKAAVVDMPVKQPAKTASKTSAPKPAAKPAKKAKK